VRAVPGRPPTAHAVADALKEMGALQLAQVRINTTIRARPWAWRNIERWKLASPEEVRAEILRYRVSPPD
jgi:hypothetical protein